MYDNVILVFFSNRILLVLQTSTTFSALSSCHDSAIWDSVRIPKQIIYGTNKTSLQEKINRFKTRSEILYSQGEEADNSNIFYFTLSVCNQSFYVVDTTSTGLVYFLHLLCNLFCCYHNWLHKNYERSLFQYPVIAMCSRNS